MEKKIIVLLFGILLIGSNLYAGDLNVSGKVGIGTTSPGASVNVVGSAGNNWSTSGWNRSIEIPNAAVIKWKKGATNAWGIGQTSNNLYFGVSSADDNSAAVTYPMYMSSGNVFFTVSTAMANNISYGGIDSAGTNRGLLYIDNSNPDKVHLRNNQRGAGGAILFESKAGGVESARFDVNGNLGINTTSPGYKLDVQGGQINASGGLCISGNCKTDWSQVGGSQWTTSGSNIYYNSGNIGIGTTGPEVSLDIKAQNNNPYSGNTVARITNTGTTASILNLVGGGTGARTFSLMSSGSGNAIGAGKFEIGDYAGKSYLTVDGNSGNVGIGTATPGAKLEVNTWAGTAPAGFNPILNLVGGYAGNNTQGHSIDFHINTLDYYPASRIISTMSTGGGGELQFHTSSWYPTTPAAARMTITSGGNVGIGTTTPSYTLTVNGSSWTSSGAWSGSDIRWKKNIMPLNTTLDKILKLKGVNYEWKKDEFKAINFSDGKQIGLIAQDVEKVFPELVKTDDEGYKAISYERLSVLLMKAVQEIAAGLDMTEAGSSSPSIKSTYKGNEAALAIDKDGNLGVGTNNPSSRLDVKGDIKTSGGISAASIASSGSITAHGNIVQSSPDLNNYGVSLERTDEDTKYHAWTFWHANTQNNTKNSLEIWEYKANEKSDACTTPDSSCYPRLVIKEGGNVGIGTAEPQSKLEVNGGDIRITGGSIIDDGTTLNVPDYVFERGYKIKSINELSAFVESNKHLPGLPDASSKTEWSKISLQERDMKLLEKIEELTVYIIKQQREIETLRAEMKKMKE